MNNTPCTYCGGRMVVNRSVDEDHAPDYGPCPRCAPVSNQISLQDHFNMLKQTVEKMRDSQKQYFSTRSKTALKMSKELEELVDKLLDSYKVPGYQQTLF